MCPRGVADRVNLGLIPSCEVGWPVACAALRPCSGGILHIHHNVSSKHMPAHINSGQSSEAQSDTPNSTHNVARDDPSTNTCIEEHSSCHGHPNQNDKAKMSDPHPTNHEHANSADCLGVLSEEEIVSSGFKDGWIKINKAWKHWTIETCKKIVHLLGETHGGEWKVSVLHVEHVKSYAPHIDHLVLDLQCLPGTH